MACLPPNPLWGTAGTPVPETPLSGEPCGAASGESVAVLSEDSFPLSPDSRGQLGFTRRQHEGQLVGDRFTVTDQLPAGLSMRQLAYLGRAHLAERLDHLVDKAQLVSSEQVRARFSLGDQLMMDVAERIDTFIEACVAVSQESVTDRRQPLWCWPEPELLV